VDSAGSVYVTGSTLSVDFPTKSPIQGAPPPKQVAPGGWASAFVTKFSPDGSSVFQVAAGDPRPLAGAVALLVLVALLAAASARGRFAHGRGLKGILEQ
jgi:hypothetical protein